MRKKFSIKGRVVALFLVFASVLGIYAVALYDLQVANRDKYTSAGRSISVSTETVKAVRGDILDRCGRVLVTNEECYNLTINMSELRKQEDTNRALLDIINFVTQEGEEYTDTFPVSKTGTKYRYLVSMTDIQQSRLSEYKKYFKLDEDISAEELMTFMAEHYDIDTSMYDREELRRIIGVRYEVEIRNIVNISPYTFASDVDSGLITKILETGMTGLDIETTWKRVYKTSYAAHILGHIGLMNEEEYEEYKDRGYAMDAYIGKDGVEKAFEEYLKGTDGTIKVGRNADGVTVAVETEVETVPGRDVMLTLDIGLQEAAEKALENCINTINSERDEDEEKATGGAAVVVQVGTGDVLASASYPSFDITAYMSDYDSLANDSSMPLYNRATMGTYSPGSTFKIVTATAALGEGVITPWTTIYDEGQFTKYSGYQPKCWIYPGSHGYEDVVDAIRDSCNYFFYVAGSETGIDSISKYAEDYGLGQTTGIEVPENTGTVASRIYKESVKNEDWYVGDTLQAAIGQSYNLFTPLQLANYSATIASNGDRYAVHLLKNVLNHNGDEIISSYEPGILSTVDVSDEIFDAIHRGMAKVAENSSTFSDYPVKVASKTGTVQSDSSSVNNGVFICYAPYDNPEVAIAVVIENGGSGAAVSNVARDILDYYFSDEYNSGTGYSENELNK